MITLKQESTLIKKLKSLTELELQTVLEELSEHIYKNKWGDMVKNALDVEDLGDEVAELERDIEELEDDKSNLEDKISDALRILEDIDDIDDDVQKKIDKAINHLS